MLSTRGCPGGSSNIAAAKRRTLLQEHIRILLSPNGARDVSINVRTGDICAEIAREAIELGSDAIILGMHGQHPMGHDRYGHTAAHVVHYSDRPVLIVKHQPTGPYRCAVIHVESLSDPSRALRVASPPGAARRASHY